MLHILGLVGKGIGITLLGILIVLIVCLLALLFVPVRYHAFGKWGENGADAKAGLHWLFHSVSVVVTWETKCHSVVRIFGISVYDNFRKKEVRKKRARKKSLTKKRSKKIPEKAADENEKREVLSAPKNPSEAKCEALEKNISEAKPEASKKGISEAKCEVPEKNLSEIKQEVPPKEESAAAQQKTKKEPGLLARLSGRIRGWFLRIWQLPKKIAEFWRKLLHMLQNIRKKTGAWKETAASYRDFVRREDFKRAFALCKKQLLRVWKNIRPRKLKAELHFGFEDPSVTGQLLAYAGMLYPFLGKDIKIRPDFEETVLEGWLFLKGRVTFFVLLKVLWILYFDKDIRRLIRIWKKEHSCNSEITSIE